VQFECVNSWFFGFSRNHKTPPSGGICFDYSANDRGSSAACKEVFGEMKIRNPNLEIRRNIKIPNGKLCSDERKRVEFSIFPFQISFGFRISKFGFISSHHILQTACTCLPHISDAANNR
jgi:hypothetical protein